MAQLIQSILQVLLRIKNGYATNTVFGIVNL